MSHKHDANRPWTRPEMDWPSLVNSMSNWERNQWARAGHPGLHKQEREKLVEFLNNLPKR